MHMVVPQQGICIYSNNYYRSYNISRNSGRRYAKNRMKENRIGDWRSGDGLRLKGTNPRKKANYFYDSSVTL